MQGVLRGSLARLAVAVVSKPHLKTAVRNSGGGAVWNYRTAPPLPTKKHKVPAMIVGGFMWWWILWHLYTEPEHITGEYPEIDPSIWTDEELGIPPDSEGLGGRTPMLYPELLKK